MAFDNGLFRRLSIMVLAMASLLCGQTLRITGGVVDDQVLQRDSAGKATLRFEGTAQNAQGRAIEAQVLRKYLPVAGFDWKTVGKVNAGTWKIEIAGVPTGGPYRVDLRLAETTDAVSVKDVLVGDLWILGGQSNMVGYGDLIDVEQPHGLVHSFDLTDRWMLAEEPLHTLHNAADRVHWPLDANKQHERWEGERIRRFVTNRQKGAGLGLAFAVEMVKRTGVPIGLIPCAHAGYGLSMDHWDPALRDKGGDSLYGSMVRRFRAVGGVVKGVLWYQGESDVPYAETFQKKFENFAPAIRKDFGQPDLPFYYVQIGRHISDANTGDRDILRELQRLSEPNIAHSAMTTSMDLALDDQGHIGTQDLKRVGKRLANLALRDLFAEGKGLERGPRPASVTLRGNVVRVGLSGVNGRLQADGRISGFSLHAENGAILPIVYKAQFDPAENTVLLYLTRKLTEKASVRYCSGKDAYCNVRDSADMALPAFGLMPIQ